MAVGPERLSDGYRRIAEFGDRGDDPWQRITALEKALRRPESGAVLFDVFRAAEARGMTFLDLVELVERSKIDPEARRQVAELWTKS